MVRNFTARIDYLTASFPVEFLDDVADLIEHYFGQRVDLQRGGRFYASSWGFGGADAFVFFSLDNEVFEVVGKDHATVELKGSALSSLDPDDFYDLFRDLMTLDSSQGELGNVLKMTRLDCAVDDFDHVIEPDALWDRYASQGLTSGPRPDKQVRGVGGHGACYFGRPGRQGGGVQLCVYDKSFQSLGQIDAVRWEARFFKAKAEKAWASLVDCLDSHELAIGVSRLVGGVIDVWEDASASHRSRRPVAVWYSSFREALGSFRVRLPSPDAPESMEQIRTWFLRTVSPRLAALRLDCADDDAWYSFLRSAAIQGERRMRPNLRRLIRVPESPVEVLADLPF